MKTKAWGPGLEHCLHGDTRVVLETGVSMWIKDLVGLPKVLS